MLQLEHDLNERIAIEVAIGMQLGHQHLERQVLMRVGSQAAFPHPPHHLLERDLPAILAA